MLAQKASGLGRPGKAMMSETRSPSTTRNSSLNQGASRCIVPPPTTRCNTSALPLRGSYVAGESESPRSYAFHGIRLAPLVIVAALLLAALYLAVHILGALIGWRDAAAVESLVVWAVIIPRLSAAAWR